MKLSAEVRIALCDEAYLATQEGESVEIEIALDRLQAAIHEAREDLAIQCAELDHHQQEGAVRPR